MGPAVTGVANLQPGGLTRLLPLVPVFFGLPCLNPSDDADFPRVLRRQEGGDYLLLTLN